MTDLEFITAPALGTPHAFTTRASGVSLAPFDGLNLGLSTGDRPEAVAQNRAVVLAAFGTEPEQVCALHQVHGTRILEARASRFEERADGMTTDRTDLTLVIGAADCHPLLFHDPVRGVVGAAHAGWRGTVQSIASTMVEMMHKRYGSDPEDLWVASGPGIQGDCYQVGTEVIEAFEAEGFDPAVAWPDEEGRYRLDLFAANRGRLIRAGVQPDRIETTGHCTHCDPVRFYSHRREGGKTGRHWALIRLPR